MKSPLKAPFSQGPSALHFPFPRPHIVVVVVQILAWSLAWLLLMLLRCVPSVCPAAAALKTAQTAQSRRRKAKETPNCWHCGYINVHYSKLARRGAAIRGWKRSPESGKFYRIGIENMTSLVPIQNSYKSSS